MYKCVQSGYKGVELMVYEDMSIEEVVNYINSELLKGRRMKEIEQDDFGVNDRVIVNRLARKNIKKVDGQFVLQSGYKMPTNTEKPVIVTNNKELKTKELIDLRENKDFLQLTNRVEIIEKYLKEISCVQSGYKVVTNEFDFKIYSNDGKPVAKTIRLYQDIWDKIDQVKLLYPHINYQTLLNSLLDEITDKYLNINKS